LTAVFLKILAFVVLITGFYGGVGHFWLTQSEDHPPPELQITVDTDTDTLVGMGETLVKAKGGCLLCHKITEQGNNRGPDLRGVGGRAALRNPGMSAEAYLMESLVEPGAYVVEEFATAGGASIMPAADRPPADMSATELKALVAYLQSLSGEVTVKITAQDVKSAEASKQQAPSSTASTHPGAALITAKACVACHDVKGSARLVGPPLTDVRERLSAAEIRQSIVDPDAVISEGYQAGLMLQNFAETLTPEELDQIVSYLSGEVSLSERLSHPAIHLAFLMLLFNAGVYAAMRMSRSASPMTAPGELTETVPGTKRPWRPVAALLGVIVLALGLYRVLGNEPSEPPEEERAAPVEPAKAAEAPVESAASAERASAALDGKALFGVTCTACHGPEAKGLPGLGKDMTTSEFIASKTDEDLVEFIKQGRAIDDPLNTTGVPMPPMGANPALSDGDLLAIVQFIRSLSK
jgi:disulfide bond formation protein DsbB